MALMAGVAGCSPAKGGGDAKAAEVAPSVVAVPVAPRVIGKGDAEKVFNEYAFSHSVAEGKADAVRIATLETGALLEESKARYARSVAQADYGRGSDTFTRPVFVIPMEGEQPGYPRSFAVFSKRDGGPRDRATAVHYFTQGEAGGPWLAAAVSWVNGDAAVAGAPDRSPYEQLGLKVRDKEIAAPRAEPEAGGGVLSATAGEDRKVCGRYAEYMTFTAPRGERESEHFVPGPLTSEVVGVFNERDDQVDGLVRHRFAYEVAGAELPVVKLADGASLVTCTYVQTSHQENKAETNWFTFKKGSPIDDMLGGGGRHWADVKSRYAVTVVFEVPPQGPAAVVASNSLAPQLLSAEGTRG
ncbi:hypothetical protein [Streptomyces sp. NPDC056883]|uniref:hypothetical protein n=1 Tax=Streptomyces sp. NPDC056883 TaxID=3345959 RepID=UPI00367834FE